MSLCVPLGEAQNGFPPFLLVLEIPSCLLTPMVSNVGVQGLRLPSSPVYPDESWGVLKTLPVVPVS
jgi:hypothetical protein